MYIGAGMCIGEGAGICIPGICIPGICIGGICIGGI